MKTTRLIVIPLLLVIALMVFGWSFIKIRNEGAQSLGSRSVAEGIEMVSPLEAVGLIRDDSVFVLDVHTPQQLHIPGTDEFIAYDQIEENQDKLPSDKSTPILVYCRSGGMSAPAARTLSKLGYTNIYDLEGGIEAYRHSIAGEVVLEPAAQDLGTVVYGDVAQTEFTLTNFSDKPLNLTRVSTSCGCTKAEAEETVLKPYSSTTLKVTFDPAVHGDDTDVGELTRTIYIATDNPTYSDIQGSITASVIK